MAYTMKFTLTPYKAFRGPNGWYTAREDASGTHHQPQFGGRMSKHAAKTEARELNARQDEDEDEPVSGYYYDEEGR